jgi:hypothetical protein
MSDASAAKAKPAVGGVFVSVEARRLVFVMEGAADLPGASDGLPGQRADICRVRPRPDDNETNQHLVRSIIHLARGLDKKTIAEGVESEPVLALLRSFGVDYAQGFHLGRPEPVAAVTANSQPHHGSPR